MRASAVWCMVVVGLASTVTSGQSSSMLWPVRQPAPEEPPRSPGETTSPRVNPTFAVVVPSSDQRPVTKTIERASFVAVPVPEPRKWKVNDLVTIIVRQQKNYVANGKLDTEKEWDLKAKVDDWFRFYPDHILGANTFSRGKPALTFKLDNKYETEGRNDREDKFTTRIQATVIDVKPNGNLVLEASLLEKHDEEEIEITLTGVCRSEDVTAANTVMSTQVAQLELIEKNRGAVRDATTRGWVPKIIDWVRPF